MVLREGVWWRSCVVMSITQTLVTGSDAESKGMAVKHRRIGSLLVMALHCSALGCNRGAGSNATEANPTVSGAAVSAAPAASNVVAGGPGDAAGPGASAAEREFAPLISAQLPHDV